MNDEKRAAGDMIQHDSDLRWSRYNRLLRAGGSQPSAGRYLYNALSNRLVELDEEHFALLDHLGENSGKNDSVPSPERAPASHAAPVPLATPASHTAPSPLATSATHITHATARAACSQPFLDMLRAGKFLVEPGEEEDELLVRRNRREAARFGGPGLSLTVCPTLACNFRCAYCFESSQDEAAVMDSGTMDRLVEFIAGFRNAKPLGVAWYGGEPLLAFGAIVELTERFRRVDPDYRGAALITNGYLLDAPKIARLNGLGIESIQITLDGPAQEHDRRRALAGGGPTFSRVMENLETLMASDYAGFCAIRVNVDRKNRAAFPLLRSALTEKFPGKGLRVYAAPLRGSPERTCGQDCFFEGGEWAEYTLDLYRDHGLKPVAGLSPGANADGPCAATTHRSFVVGPSGELYKCWKDTGRPDMVVGSVRAKEAVTNPALQARYSVGVDPWDDPECRECEVLPICGGGCANTRLRMKYSGETGLDRCSPYKKNLVAYLEAWIDDLRTKEICAALLAPLPMPLSHGSGEATKSEYAGWRVISSGTGRDGYCPAHPPRSPAP